jgi:hypothetical protein
MAIDMRKKLIIVFFIFLNLFVAISCFRGYPSYEEVVESRSKIKPISFTREKWFDKKGIGVEALWETRPGLARDLINRNLLIGKNYTEVQELLGEQSRDNEDNSVSYELYVENGFADPIFIEYLIINFDENQKVKSAKTEVHMMDGHPDYR